MGEITYIREKNIHRVIATTKDGNASVIYTKYTRDDLEYHCRYGYSEEFMQDSGHQFYCDRCGEIYSDSTSCPTCNGNEDCVIDYKNIDSVVSDSKDDGLNVVIELWSGEKIEA